MKSPTAFLSFLFALALVMVSALPPGVAGDYDLRAAGEIPTLVNGRVKPLDTVARTSLLLLQGRQRVDAPGQGLVSPMAWLLDVLYRPEIAKAYATFEIVNPDVLALIGLNAEDGKGMKRFSLAQISKALPDIDRQSKLADSTESTSRSPFQRALIELREKLILFQRLQSSLTPPDDSSYFEKVERLQVARAHGSARFDPAFVAELSREFSTMDALAYLLPIPPEDQMNDLAKWKSVGNSIQETLTGGPLNSAVLLHAQLGNAWQKQDPSRFNTAVQTYRARLHSNAPSLATKMSVEARFNSAEPFTTSMELFIGAFLLSVLSWLIWPRQLTPAAFVLLISAFVLTSCGIAVRMWLEGRPPVTNLYSSALFVGCSAVALCLLLEFFYKNAIGSAAGGIIGFCTLLIAHHLSLAGDTLEMMRAVLDSNFWLATHVVTVTIGYSATFLAGFLGLIYVLRGTFTRTLDPATALALSRMIYGIVCFATLFSFVGTVLGGIWADQSWGRFWGWDPKENGALIIVIWNSVILHARWGGMIQQRGLASAVIFGNIVTAWSWFGVNMLGIGLHSYGFMDAAFWWLIIFVVSQLAVIGVAGMSSKKG
jgi:ABC-type transport system involved in cytochrome c biogenesis permease subunit